ncbi:hypothetical protein GS399_05215 [Pedobacter sp. HMF7647]|uniref:RteC protein n=1 Tax=Hufsiella arboris TaxID=2695275 RepID=A0A7K1Y724_9SPHI|nr:RteC domain-containing protein [Hufsiella arboris]MXV50364.1 hypothetical protein [Hufsiella arboris]
MEDLVCRLEAALSAAISALGESQSEDAAFYYHAVLLARKAMLILRRYTTAEMLQAIPSQINYFKKLKPRLYNRFIYFVTFYSIECERPIGNKDHQLAYYRSKKEALGNFIEQHREFYRYYRSGQTYLDEVYFVLCSREKFLPVVDFHAEPGFSSSHDYLLAKIQAYEQVIAVLDRKFRKLRFCDRKIQLKWTASQAAFVELVYAFHCCGVFNHGGITIRELARELSEFFQTEPGDLYRLFQDCRFRKKDRTKFLSFLSKGLLQHMDGLDAYK